MLHFVDMTLFRDSIKVMRRVLVYFRGYRLPLCIVLLFSYRCSSVDNILFSITEHTLEMVVGILC